CFHGRRDMLENLARKDKIVLAKFVFVWTHDVEARRTVMERVSVIEFLRQQRRVMNVVAGADAPQALHARKVRHGEARGKQFQGQSAQESTLADRRAARPASRGFPG